MSVIRAIAVFLCGFLSLKVCQAQIIMAGGCPDVKIMENFDLSRYLGRWYEAEKYFAIFQFGGTCVTADYSLRDDGLVKVVNNQENTLTGSPQRIKGSAKQPSQEEKAKLIVSFPSSLFNVDAPYWVLDTDYDSYSVVWGCLDLGVLHAVNTWILTREREAPVSVLEKAYKVLDKNNINKSLLLRTNQKGCKEPTE